MVFQNTWNNHRPLLQFLGVAFVFYISWSIINGIFIEPDSGINVWLRDSESFLASGLFNICGFDITYYHISERQTMLCLSSDCLIGISNGCNALVLFIIYTGFILAYPAPIKSKSIYFITGNIIIYAINMVRIIALIFIQIYAPEYLDFNHHYVFTILVYGSIFLVWRHFVNRHPLILAKNSE